MLVGDFVQSELVILDPEIAGFVPVWGKLTAGEATPLSSQ